MFPFGLAIILGDDKNLLTYPVTKIWICLVICDLKGIKPIMFLMP